jgi:hypothetical protein
MNTGLVVLQPSSAAIPSHSYQLVSFRLLLEPRTGAHASSPIEDTGAIDGARNRDLCRDRTLAVPILIDYKRALVAPKPLKTAKALK